MSPPFCPLATSPMNTPRNANEVASPPAAKAPHSGSGYHVTSCRGLMISAYPQRSGTDTSGELIRAHWRGRYKAADSALSGDGDARSSLGPCTEGSEALRMTARRRPPSEGLASSSTQSQCSRASLLRGSPIRVQSNATR